MMLVSFEAKFDTAIHVFFKDSPRSHGLTPIVCLWEANLMMRLRLTMKCAKNEHKVFYGQEPPSGEYTTTEYVFN